jgi:hypothetical protein
MSISHTARRACEITLALVLGAALSVIGSLLSGASTVAAQTPNSCGLLTDDEVHALAPRDQVGAGVATAIPAMEFSSCRYTWGTGTRRFTLAISVTPASRMYVGMSADGIKHGLMSSIVPKTTDATIPDVGDAAVFKASSPMSAGVSAYLKGRILQINLDGFDAREMKGTLIALLKSAASRL